MRDFFKHTLSTLLALCIFAGIGIGGLLMLVVAIAASGSNEAKPIVQKQSMLMIDMGQAITDAEPEVSARDLIQNGRPNVIQLRPTIKAIAAATTDNRISGIFLFNRDSSESNGSSFANLKEVREGLEKFQASGKKIYAYSVDWSEKEYYLASVADTIGMNPMGSFELNGLSSETMFYGGALEKFGVGVQAIWRGKYKSAIEPWVRKSRSEASRQQTAKLLTDIWQEFLDTSGKGRKLDAKTLQTLSDTKGILTPKEAKEAKVVDQLVYNDQMIDELKKITGEDKESKSFKQISLANYIETVDLNGGKTGDRVAVIYASGDIVNGQGGPGSIGGDSLSRQLRKIRQDDDIKAVVLRVNSPGGSATASDIIQRELILTKKIKPIVISMGGVAASGGYWIATYGSKIFAEPNTITGSIGVYGLQPNFQKVANENGITWDAVKTGKFADSMTISRPKNKEEIAVIQRTIGEIYDQFISKVSESRKLDKAKVAEIAQGRVWSGLEAKKLGLVDEIGGLEQSIAAAAGLAKLGDNWQVQEYPEVQSIETRFLRSLFGNSRLQSFFQAEAQPQAQDVFSAELKNLQTDFNSLRALNDPRGIYMRMPENLRIK
jgi:protease IV